MISVHEIASYAWVFLMPAASTSSSLAQSQNEMDFAMRSQPQQSWQFDPFIQLAASFTNFLQMDLRWADLVFVTDIVIVDTYVERIITFSQIATQKEWKETICRDRRKNFTDKVNVSFQVGALVFFCVDVRCL